MVLRETNGRGVDMVLNSLAEEKLLTSVRCLARGGRMIEIGKYDLKSNNKLSLLLFQKEGSFHGVMLDMFFTLSPAESLGLSQIMSEGIKEGSIKPLNRHIFKFDEVEQAFRFLAGGKHMGKVIIEVRPEEETVDLPKLHMQEFTAIPRLDFIYSSKVNFSVHMNNPRHHIFQFFISTAFSTLNTKISNIREKRMWDSTFTDPTRKKN